MVNVAVVFNAGEQESEVRYHCEFAFLVGHYVSIESRQLVRPFEVLCDGRNAQQRLEHISLLLNGLSSVHGWPPPLHCRID